MTDVYGIRIEIDAGRATSSLSSLQGALNSTSQLLAALQSGMGRSSQGFGLLSTSLSRISQSLSQSSKEANASHEAFNKLRSMLGGALLVGMSAFFKANVSTAKSLKDIQTTIDGRLTTSIENLNKSIASLVNQIAEMGTESNKTKTQLSELSTQMDSAQSSSVTMNKTLDVATAVLGRFAKIAAALAVIIIGPVKILQTLAKAIAYVATALTVLPGAIGAAFGKLAAFATALSVAAGNARGLLTGLALLKVGAIAVGAILGGALLGGLISLAKASIQATEKVTLLQSRLRVLSGGELAFRGLIKSVEELNTSIEASGSVAQRFIMMRTEIGLTTKEAQQLADNFTKIGVITGASMNDFNIAALQFSQALGSGRLQGDELRSIMEAMPYLGKVLAEQLGIGVGQLKRMGAEGKLTADIISKGILSSTEKLNVLYKTMPLSLGQANQALETQKTLLLAHLGNLTGIYDWWVKIVKKASEYVKVARTFLGDPLAELDPADKIKELDEKIKQLRSELSGGVQIPRIPGPTDIGKAAAKTLFPFIAENELKSLEEQRAKALNNLIAMLRKEDDLILSDMEEIEVEGLKKLTSGIIDVSKELKDTFSDLGMYTDFERQLDKIRDKFEEIRRKVIAVIPDEGIRQSLIETVNSAEKQQLNIATESYNQEKLNSIAEKFNDILKSRPALLNDIRDAAKKFNVDEKLIIGVISQESSFNPNALGPPTKYGRAKGAMQLIDATANRFNVENPFNQRQNIMGGTAYLSWLSKRFSGDIDKILAGYNAGEGRVDQYNGVPPFAETIKYVKEIKEKMAAMTVAGDKFNQMLSGLEFGAYEKAATDLNTLDKAQQQYIDQVQLLVGLTVRGKIPQEEFNRQLVLEKENFEKIINPNKEMIDQLERQNTIIKGNDFSVRGEQTVKLRQETEQLADQLDKTSQSFEEDQRRGFNAIQVKVYTEQLMAVGIQIKEVARAQEQFNIENELAQKLVAQNAVTEQEYQRWLVGRKDALDSIAEPNKKMLDNLEAELTIYRQFAGSDNGGTQIQQALAMRQAIESVNKSSPTYEQDVERIKAMTLELEAFKEQLSATNNQTELFKEAATGIYEAWTGAFESIFEKGIKGFSDMKDQILSLFKKLLAQMIATAAARPVMVPLIQTMGEAFGMQGTAQELTKQFGGAMLPAAGGNWAAYGGAGTLQASARATVNNPAGGPGGAFVPAGAMTTGIPGWSYGAAGLGGYMVGNYLGGGSPMSQFLGAGSAVGGAYLGGANAAAIGALLGTSITPVIGTILGGIVGALGGALMGGLFGGGGDDKKPVPRARLRQGTGGRIGTTTPFGAVGFSELRVEHGMDQDLINQGREFLATVRDFEESIAQVLDPGEIQKVKDALANFKSSSTDFAGVLKDRVTVIADAINLSYRTLLGDTKEMDVEAIAERLGTLKELENALTKTLDDITEAAAIQSGGYDIKVADTLNKLKDEFDRWTGSTPQLQEITSLVEERYQLEIDRLNEIKSISENIQSGTEKLLMDMERTGLTQTELLADWRDQMATAMGSIGNLSDPAEIQEAVNDYQEAAQSAFSILSDLLNQFNSAKETITEAGTSRATAIRRGSLSATDLSAALQTEFAQRQAAIQSATTPEELTAAFNDLQTTLNDWLSVEQSLIDETGQQIRSIEELKSAIDDATKSITQSTEEQVRTIRYSALSQSDLIAALQADLSNQQSKLMEATTPEAINEFFLDIQGTLQQWMDAEQSASQALEESAIQLKSAIDDATKSIRESALEQAKSIRYKALNTDELISALQADLATQQAGLAGATTPESITESYNTIQNILQQWMTAEESAIQAANAELQTAEELQKTVDDLRKGLREFIDDLKISDISPLKPSEKLAEAQQKYAEILNKAQSGDTKSLGELSNAAQEYLSQAREFYASSPDYTKIFNSVVSTLDTLQQQFTATDLVSDEETRMKALAETFAQRFESISQMAIERLASISIEQTQIGTAALAEVFAQRFEAAAQMAIERLAAISTEQAQSGTAALAEVFAQRFEAAAQAALERLTTLQAEQLGGVGNLKELADQFQSGIEEMSRRAQEQLQLLQDNALARYQEFTAALDETLRNGAGVLSDSLQAAFDAGAAVIADAVAGRYAAESQSMGMATIIPFPMDRVAAAANVSTTAANQDELEEQLDAIVNALGQLGVIVQVSTKEQTSELIKAQPITAPIKMPPSTKQVF